jgi:hypothetical protein
LIDATFFPHLLDPAERHIGATGDSLSNQIASFDLFAQARDAHAPIREGKQRRDVQSQRTRRRNRLVSRDLGLATHLVPFVVSWRHLKSRKIEGGDALLKYYWDARDGTLAPSVPLLAPTFRDGGCHFALKAFLQRKH